MYCRPDEEPMNANEVINLAHRWQYFLRRFEASFVTLTDPETIVVVAPDGTVQTYPDLRACEVRGST
jgi:hypothetical protein